MSSMMATSVYCATSEKYFGIVSESSGRMAGKQAQMIPVLISRADSVACTGLSKDKSLVLATSSRVESRMIETRDTLCTSTWMRCHVGFILPCTKRNSYN
jgi:hypothetical protein